MIDYVDNWQKRLRGRLAEQFKGLPHMQALVDAFAEQIQELEDSGQALLTLASIDDSEGAQLRLLGALVGQPYTGEDDATYRLRLKARIRANKSSGTPEHLYAVFVALFDGDGSATIVPAPPAGMVFRVNTPLDIAEALVLLGFLGDAKVGGVRLWLEWQAVDDADAFCFEGGTGKGFGDESSGATGGCFAGALVVA